MTSNSTFDVLITVIKSSQEVDATVGSIPLVLTLTDLTERSLLKRGFRMLRRGMWQRRDFWNWILISWLPKLVPPITNDNSTGDRSLRSMASRKASSRHHTLILTSLVYTLHLTRLFAAFTVFALFDIKLFRAFASFRLAPPIAIRQQ